MLKGFQSNQHNLDRAFAEYLEGKTVAIVGRANLDQEQGDLIDSHDVVVRMHSALPYTREASPGEYSGWDKDEKVTAWTWPPFVPEEWQSRIGKRTSIFYHKFRAGPPDWLKSNVDAFRADGGKFFCVATFENANSLESTNIWEFIPVRYLNPEHFLRTILVVGTRPMPGTLIITDILRHNVKSAYITGFPCYVRHDQPQGVSKSGHVTINDLKYLASLTRQYPERVQYDLMMTQQFQDFIYPLEEPKAKEAEL